MNEIFPFLPLKQWGNPVSDRFSFASWKKEKKLSTYDRRIPRSFAEVSYPHAMIFLFFLFFLLLSSGKWLTSLARKTEGGRKEVGEEEEGNAAKEIKQKRQKTLQIVVAMGKLSVVVFVPIFPLHSYSFPKKVWQGNTKKSKWAGNEIEQAP